MAQQQHQDTPEIGFKSIQLLKDQTLGIGGFGSVCKALCDNLFCAAKIIHQTLVDPNLYRQVERNKEHRVPYSRFMQECEFMSAIKHPNIVQFLGTHQDPQTGLPVLLMELMDDSLTHFLESSQDTVPYHIQVNFCHDITLAITYLHSNGITHRDLSSNNVLLRGNVKAKVTDFGMAQLGDRSLQATRISFTLCPGTDVYMPPEAVKDEAEYTEKIDCFAIGALIIQILTRVYPDPGNRVKTERTTDPRFPTANIPVPEVERRQNHISLVNPNHPLLPIALDCLKDSDVERPSALELCHRVEVLKETPQFTQSAKIAQERLELAASGNTIESEEQLRELQQQLQDKDEEIQEKDGVIQQKAEEIHRARQDHYQEIVNLQNDIKLRDKNWAEKESLIYKRDITIKGNEAMIPKKIQILEQKEKQLKEAESRLQKTTEEFESSEKALAQYPIKITELKEQLKNKTLAERIQELEEKLKRKTQAEVQARLQKSLEGLPKSSPSGASPKTATPAKRSFTLKWREGKKAPCKMVREADAVVDGDVVYLRAGAQTIYAYNSTKKTWNQLPDCESTHFPIAIIKGLLTAIGGKDRDRKETNKLFSLTVEDGGKRWTEVFPPMPTKRSSSIAVSTEQALIVAGGLENEGWTKLSTVEIMDTTTYQWLFAESLISPLFEASATICKEKLYLVGGRSSESLNFKQGLTESVYFCNLSNLIKGSTPKPPSHAGRWYEISNHYTLPYAGSTCVTLHDQLLAIGGYKHRESTSDVYMYNGIKWEVISKLKTGRHLCFAVVLPTNELMVIEGHTEDKMLGRTYSVEIATAV